MHYMLYKGNNSYQYILIVCQELSDIFENDKNTNTTYVPQLFLP